MENNKCRGFGRLTEQQRKEMAAIGGKAISKKEGHMSKIGKIGGQKISENRARMSELGKLGGKARALKYSLNKNKLDHTSEE